MLIDVIQAYMDRKLIDSVFETYRDVQDAAAEMAHVLPCPRCGGMFMKQKLCTNALSRHVPDIMICDGCGTEEAIEDMLGEQIGTEQWALIRRYMKGAELV